MIRHSVKHGARGWLMATAMAVLCLTLTAPAMAHGGGGGAGDDASCVDATGKSDCVMRVERIAYLACTLDPAGQLQDSFDPAARVTVTGTGWKLYAVWDGPTGASRVSARTVAEPWRPLSAARLLIASSPAIKSGKQKGGPPTAVIDVAVRVQLGAEGVDPWSVKPGTYLGNVRFTLQEDGGCGQDGPSGSASDEPTECLGSDATGLEASLTAEVPSAGLSPKDAGPALPGVESTLPPTVETSATLGTTAGDLGESDDGAAGSDVDSSQSATAPAEASPAEPSEEASATAPAADESTAEPSCAPPQASRTPLKRWTTVRRRVPPKDRRKRAQPRAVSKTPDPEDEPSAYPTATPEPEPDPAPAAP